MAESWIRSVWQHNGLFGIVAWLLSLPLAGAYRLAVDTRNLFYSRRWLRVEELARPVISIGNLTVGGTGKTPSVIWLAQELSRRGIKVAVLSRGYKRSESGPAVLLPEDGDILP